MLTEPCKMITAKDAESVLITHAVNAECFNQNSHKIKQWQTWYKANSTKE